MKKITGVEIRKIEPAAKEDHRGRTYEWCKGEHRFEALAHSILIEYRSTVYDPKHPDTYPNVHLGSGSNKNGGR